MSPILMAMDLPAQWNWVRPFLESHSAMVLVGISGGKMTGKGNSFLYSVIVNTLCVRGWGGSGGVGCEGGS